MRVGIIQSNYVPWKGYFDFIAACDRFVLLDDVQFTRRDWRNRNRIKGPSGPRWLTIPVVSSGRYEQRIDQTEVADTGWHARHLALLRQTYADAACFREIWPLVESLYRDVGTLHLLSDINERMIRSLAAALGIDTPIDRSEAFKKAPGKNERLIDIARALGADEYLSGPAARSYLDLEQWRRAGIAVVYKSYDGYPEYPQPYPPFDHHVSVLDLMFATGSHAPSYLRSSEGVVTDDD